MKIFLGCIMSVWSIWALASTLIPDYSMQNYDRAIQKIYHDPKLNTKNITNRVEIISGLFLDRPYLEGSLGEGKNSSFDEHPLYRTDAFDCVTYVSTVLALAESNNLIEFKKNMLKVQHRNSIPTFVNRLHFTGLDWNTVNAKNSFIRDITPSFKNVQGEAVAKTAHALINKPRWHKTLTANHLYLLHPLTSEEEKKRLMELHNLSSQVHEEKSSVSYIPLTTLFNAQGEANTFVFNQIPSGAIIEIVRPNWNLDKLIGTHLNISHLGFAIRTPEGIVFREASSIQHRVVDVPLISYLKGYLDSSTVKGINIQLIVYP